MKIFIHINVDRSLRTFREWRQAKWMRLRRWVNWYAALAWSWRGIAVEVSVISIFFTTGVIVGAVSVSRSMAERLELAEVDLKRVSGLREVERKICDRDASRYSEAMSTNDELHDLINALCHCPTGTATYVHSTRKAPFMGSGVESAECFCQTQGAAR